MTATDQGDLRQQLEAAISNQIGRPEFIFGITDAIWPLIAPLLERLSELEAEIERGNKRRHRTALSASEDEFQRTIRASNAQVGDEYSGC